MTLDATLYVALVPSGLIIGHLGIAARIFRGGPSVETIVRLLALIWSATLAVTWGLRASAVGHRPQAGMYESAISLALATVVVALIWEVFHRGRTVITPLAVLISSALLSHGERFEPTASGLLLSERSWVVDTHAVIAWLAFGVLALSNFLALRIVLGRTEGDDLERPLVKALQLGFLLLTAMIVSGVVSRLIVSGTAWSFDPVESMALIVWAAYASLLSMHFLANWKGKRLAGWTLGLFILLALSFRTLVYFPPGSTYHVFDMDHRIGSGPKEIEFREERR